MEKDLLDELTQLYNILLQVIGHYKYLQEKDIRLIHFQFLANEVLFSRYTLQVHMLFQENSPQGLSEIFGGDKQQLKNYAHKHSQNINNNLFSSFVFQTELLLRIYYSKIEGKQVTPGSEGSIEKIIKFIYDDTNNNKTSEEADLLILIWKLRNTIHTGGIYFQDPKGLKVPYKGEKYTFDYGKKASFLNNGFLFEILSNMIDALDLLFKKEKIINLGFIEHPTYYAFGYN